MDGIVVLDDDAAEGREWLAQRDLPITLMAKTTRGYHRYYKGRPRARNKIGPHVDLKGAVGYVMAPPSLHKSGERYRWVDIDTPIADAPAWLATAAWDAGSRAKTKPPVRRVRVTAPRRPSAIVRPEEHRF